jgi:hypothetical protein
MNKIRQGNLGWGAAAAQRHAGDEGDAKVKTNRAGRGCWFPFIGMHELGE